MTLANKSAIFLYFYCFSYGIFITAFYAVGASDSTNLQLHLRVTVLPGIPNPNSCPTLYFRLLSQNFYLKTAKITRVKILIILRMRVTTDEVTYIHSAGSLVAKLQIHSTVTRVFCSYYTKSAHSTFCAAKLLHFSDIHKKNRQILAKGRFLGSSRLVNECSSI